MLLADSGGESLLLGCTEEYVYIYIYTQTYLSCEQIGRAYIGVGFEKKMIQMGTPFPKRDKNDMGWICFTFLCSGILSSSLPTVYWEGEHLNLSLPEHMAFISSKHDSQIPSKPMY